ncbi:tyrosine-protein phosphatase YwqE [Lewinella aquimaris]|uniref:protein-tyrosine-phosphatase n=1 Tax=Neolewinella aquimaris TaxID=1835722 RepID=A0A840E5A0_9BACT|nr:CpsB/CapC family capsule biosynthesis tyrosine phosphatase [Neolewinella aquimaris]MBB4080240.1 tyrosine-protein phosphatase YwqE [Neolewinella aquimaris]
MFGFFQRKGKTVGDFGFLRVDMHAHWLPGIDDGASSLEESIEMIERLKLLGYKKLIATPHVMSDLYPNTSAEIRTVLGRVREEVQRRGIPIELDAAAEYLVDENFGSLIETNDLLTLPGNQVLIEYSFVAPPPQRDDILFVLQAKGYKIVLAHPERYYYYHQNQQELADLVGKGIKLQINLGSLSGMYGSRVQRAAKDLIKAGLIAYAGTDAHNMDHLENIRSMTINRKASRILTSTQWGNRTL